MENDLKSQEDNAIEIQNICKTFYSSVNTEGNKVLKGVNLVIKKGTISGLIGPSSGGKSVLLKIISKVLRQDSGTVDLRTSSSSLLFQEGALFDSLNVFDNVAFPIVSGKVPTYLLKASIQEEVTSKVNKILDKVGLLWAKNKMPAELSGGMKRRVSLARALVSNPELVFLDDPTGGLDPVASSVIMNLIIESQKEFKSTMVIVSHDLRRLLPAVEKVYALFSGTITFSGTLPELKSSSDAYVKDFVKCRYDLDNIGSI